MSRAGPRVSIVTAVRNGARHLQQAITSVANQDYPNIEYIIIDGGSTDGTLGIVERNRQHIYDTISRPDRGLYFAMNEGIARSTGEIVGIINADDWYEPGAIQAVVEEYLASDRQTIIYGVTRYYDERGLDMILSYDHSRLPTRMINHPSTFVPRAVYDRIGLFDTQYRVAADYDFLLRAYRGGISFRHVEKILANFRHGGFSARHSSHAEVLRIQRDHGYLGGAEYVVANAKRLARNAAAWVIG